MKYILLGFICIFSSSGLIAQNTESNIYGTEFSISEVVPVAMLFSAPSSYLDKTISLRGKITTVCQKAGCWATMGDKGEELLIKFGEHDFTIPTDLRGSVVAYGTLTEKVQTVKELRQLAREEGKNSREIKMITEPKIEYIFMASGLQKI